jgi:ABC-2 type transport system permease protein
MSGQTIPAQPVPGQHRRAAARPLRERGRAGFGAALAAEWTKLVTVRAPLWLSVAAAALIPTVAALVGVTESITPTDTILASSLLGASTAALLAGVLGVVVITTEHASGVLSVTATATPRRVTVLAAKAIVVAAPLAVLAGASSFAAYRIGVALLADGPYATGSADLLPVLLGTALYFAAVGLFGLAVGTLLRHTAGAVATVLGVILLPYIVGGMLPDAWSRWVVGACPMTALIKLHGGDSVDPAVMGNLGAWPSLALVAAYMLAVLGVGAWRLSARDI